MVLFNNLTLYTILIYLAFTDTAPSNRYTIGRHRTNARTRSNHVDYGSFQNNNNPEIHRNRRMPRSKGPNMTSILTKHIRKLYPFFDELVCEDVLYGINGFFNILDQIAPLFETDPSALKKLEIVSKVSRILCDGDQSPTDLLKILFSVPGMDPGNELDGMSDAEIMDKIVGDFFSNEWKQFTEEFKKKLAEEFNFKACKTF